MLRISYLCICHYWLCLENILYIEYTSVEALLIPFFYVIKKNLGGPQGNRSLPCVYYEGLVEDMGQVMVLSPSP